MLYGNPVRPFEATSCHLEMLRDRHFSSHWSAIWIAFAGLTGFDSPSNLRLHLAEVVKLVDTLASGASGA